MNSISPQMLDLFAGDVTLVTTPGEATPSTSGPILKRLLRIARRRRGVLIGGVLAGAAAGLLATFLLTPEYASTVRLQISRDTAQVVSLGATSRDVPVGDQEFYQTQYGLLRTQELAERVARDLGVVDDPTFFQMLGRSREFAANPGPAGLATRNAIAGEILLRRIEVAPVHGSSLVDVQATTPSAALSQKIARTWAQDFMAANLDRRLEASTYASQFLATRLGQLRDRVESSERRAMDYAASHGIIELPSPGEAAKSSGRDIQGRSLVTDDLAALNGALQTATAERIAAASRLAAAQAQPGASSDALNYRAIGLLRDERADAASEYARLAARDPESPDARASHAEVEALDAAISNEENRVHTALKQTYQAAVAREQALTGRVNALKGALAELRQRSVQYNIYRRDAETNRELYDALLQRYKEIGVAGAAETNNVAVVDPARLPAQPTSPRLSLDLLLFTAAGALLGGLAAALLEQIEDGVRDAGEFEARLDLPLLGVIPKVKTPAVLEALENPTSPLTEAYLAAEAGLELSRARVAPKSMAVISTRRGEGKSITAVALAEVLARSGRKVVLIDADLRSPWLHSAFGLSNAAGLCDLLSGNDGLEAVLHTTRREGLCVIPSGPAPSNPAHLLMGEGLARLVKALEDRFEHVILDGPPVADLADATLVAAAVEGVIYSVKARSTPITAIRAALGRLQRAQLLGGVLTMVEVRRPGSLAPQRFRRPPQRTARIEAPARPG